jgi:hypothetical protein
MLFHLLNAAEFEARGAPGFLGCHSPGDVLFRFCFEVIRDFVIQLLVEFPTPK